MTTWEARPHRTVPPAGKLIPFARPRRPRTSTAPEHLLHSTEATLRAAEVHSRLLIDRLERARRTNDRGHLGALDATTLLHIAAVGEALERMAAEALAQIDRELARRAQLVAEAVRSVVPPADSGR